MSPALHSRPAPASLPRESRRRLSHHLLSLLLYALLTVLMTWPLAAQVTTVIPGDSFDGWQNYWNQWWIKVALVDRLRLPFTTDLLYHPTGVDLYFHTLNPFNGLATLPVQLSGGLLLAYNGVVWLSWVLGGYGTYLLALWLLAGPGHGSARIAPGRARPAAFVAGVIFVFSPFHMAHLLGHMQVMSLQWIPFYILALLRATHQVTQRRPWQRDGLLAGLFLVWVGLCDWYYVLYLFLFTALLIGVQTVLLGARALRGQRPSGLPPALAPALLAGATFLLLLAPILLPMVQQATQFSFMVRPASDLIILSASLVDFLLPNRLHALFRPESFGWPGNQIAPVSERTIAIGYGALALAIWGLWRDSRRAGLWIAAALFFATLAMGPRIHLGSFGMEAVTADAAAGGWSPYSLLNRLIPFMRISRSVSRFAVMVQLGVAVAAAVGLAALAGGRRRWWWIGGVLIWILAEYWVAPYPLSPPDTPAFYQQLGAEPGGAVLNLPMNYDRPGYLLYQTVHRKPLTVAYISRDDPRTLTERVPVLQHWRHLGPDIVVTDPVAVGLTVLNDLDVGFVVLDNYKMPTGLERTYTTELALAIFAEQTALYLDERLRVYRVPPVASPRPYLTLGPTQWGPLQVDGAGLASRTVGEKPAALLLRHLPQGAALRVSYRSPVGIEAEIRRPGSAQAAAMLPPAPQGNTVHLELGALFPSAQLPSELELQIVAAVPHRVAISALELWVDIDPPSGSEIGVH